MHARNKVWGTLIHNNLIPNLSSEQCEVQETDEIQGICFIGIKVKVVPGFVSLGYELVNTLLLNWAASATCHRQYCIPEGSAWHIRAHLLKYSLHERAGCSSMWGRRLPRTAAEGETETGMLHFVPNRSSQLADFSQQLGGIERVETELREYL